MDTAHELIQLTERALADAEQALRADPSEANRRRVQKAWQAVRRARGDQWPPDGGQHGAPFPPIPPFPPVTE